MSEILNSEKDVKGTGSRGSCSERAQRLLAETPLIDGHNDFPYIVRGWHQNALNSSRFDLHTLPEAHTDLTRLHEGRVGAQIWSAYVPSPAANKRNDFTAAEHFNPLLETLQQIDLIHIFVKRYCSQLGLATRASDVWEVFRGGRVASLIGIEGLHQIANSASVLRMLFALGVRYATLTHSQNNLYADSATSEKPIHGGLSERGRAVVKEMNRIGMIVDLSHTSTDTQRQVLTLSRAPVIYSHSSCSAICPHPRNTSDDCLHLLKKNRGVIMVSFIPSLTDKNETEANLSHVADHIVYVGALIGYEHVGIGSDLDGIMNTVHGLEDVSKFPALVDELLNRGLSDEQVRGILGVNFLRVFSEVERFATGWKEQDDILCDEIEAIFDEKLRAEMWYNRVENKLEN